MGRKISTKIETEITRFHLRILEAKADSSKMDARYWEVIPDGKTPRSPLVYHQIVMQLISLIDNSKIDTFPPDKITFEFNKNPQVMRKVSKSCEYISLA